MSLRRVAARTLATVRSVWLFLGVVVLLLGSMEVCYRVQGAARRSIGAILHPRPGGAPHPYATFDWYPDFAREEELSNALVWKPYVYFRRRPFAGKYINVDSVGHRRTLQPAGSGGGEPVLFLGGSTMFGSPQRDDFTLPSRMAARIGTLPAGRNHLEVINLGETGYVFTQSVLELEMQLRDGLRPRVVVFYDGINDVVAGLQNGRGGMPQNEQNRAVEFSMGRVVFNWKHDAGAELRAAAALASLGLRRMEMIQGLAARAGAAASQDVSPDTIAARVADAYVETARLAEALATEYGFTALYVWQPNFHTTRKILTPYEVELRTELESQPFQVTLRGVHARMPALVGQRMAQLVGDRFVDASRTFDGDSTAVFVDVIGHTTESAVERIADAMWPAFDRALAASAMKVHPGR